MQISGIVIPTILPLDANGDPDAISLGRLVERAIDGGIKGCWVNGTSGGFHHASDEQRERVLEIVLEATGDRIPVIAHVGDTSLERALARTRHARQLGVHHVAAITPYYVELERRELEDHHRRISEAFDGPIFMYQHPATGDRGLSIESIIALAEEGVVAGIKESGPDLPHFAALCTAVHDADMEFACMHGAAGTALQSLSGGGDGLVTVMANILPGTMCRLYESFQGGAIEDAHRFQELVLEVADAIKAAMPRRSTPGSVVIAYTHLLARLGVITNDTVFAPLRGLEDHEAEALDREVLPRMESAEAMAASRDDGRT